MASLRYPRNCFNCQHQLRTPCCEVGCAGHILYLQREELCCRSLVDLMNKSRQWHPGGALVRFRKFVVELQNILIITQVHVALVSNAENGEIIWTWRTLRGGLVADIPSCMPFKKTLLHQEVLSLVYFYVVVEVLKNKFMESRFDIFTFTALFGWEWKFMQMKGGIKTRQLRKHFFA